MTDQLSVGELVVAKGKLATIQQILSVKRTQAVCQVGCEIPGLNLGTAFETGRLESCREGYIS